MGSGHTGVEDFLTLGRDFSCWLLENLAPKIYLEALGKRNGGPDGFAMIRTLRFPSNTDEKMIRDYLQSFYRIYEECVAESVPMIYPPFPLEEDGLIIDQKLKGIIEKAQA